MINMYDLLVVGAGPAGLAVAAEAGKLKLKCLVIDKGTVVDALTRFPINMTFFTTSDLLELSDVPFTSHNIRPTRQEAIHYYQNIVRYFRISVKTFERLEAVRNSNQGFEITTKGSIKKSDNLFNYQTKHIVLATGFFDRPKCLHIAGEDLPHVSHYYTEAYPYFNRRVLVIGGGNSAIEAALDIHRHGGYVTMMHRGLQIEKSIKYWILPDFQNRVKEGSINLILNAQPTEIKSNQVLYKQDNENKSHACDSVLALTGYEPDPDIFDRCSIDYNTETLEPVMDADNYQSSRSGIYLAGSLIAGRFSNRIFIENSRLHAKPIVEHIKSKLEG